MFNLVFENKNNKHDYVVMNKIRHYKDTIYCEDYIRHVLQVERTIKLFDVWDYEILTENIQSAQNISLIDKANMSTIIKNLYNMSEEDVINCIGVKTLNKKKIKHLRGLYTLSMANSNIRGVDIIEWFISVCPVIEIEIKRMIPKQYADMLIAIEQAVAYNTNTDVEEKDITHELIEKIRMLSK